MTDLYGLMSKICRWIFAFIRTVFTHLLSSNATNFTPVFHKNHARSEVAHFSRALICDYPALFCVAYTRHFLCRDNFIAYQLRTKCTPKIQNFCFTRANCCGAVEAYSWRILRTIALPKKVVCYLLRSVSRKLCK